MTHQDGAQLHANPTTIKLSGGRYFDFQSPESSTFDIRDIAHALANICRYTGHCHTFYSVAQHSVLVSLVVPKEHSFAGLMHDAAEAFIGDVSRPLKLMLPDYRQIEARVEAAVFARFGLPQQLPNCVKDADNVLLRTEQRDMMGADSHCWSATDGVEPLAYRIQPISPIEAELLFLRRFWMLK